MRILMFVLSALHLWIAVIEGSVNLANDVKCGQVPAGSGRKGRVFGGHPTTVKNFPHAVSITRNNKHHCGGTIIDKYHVLSAAHCFFDYNHRTFGAQIGATRSDGSDASQRTNVIKIMSHPDFDHKVGTNDIAIVRLTNAVDWTDLSQPICLPDFDPSKKTLGASMKKRRMAVCGWGHDGHNNFRARLQTAEMKVVEESECRSSEKQFKILMENNAIFCAGEDDVDTCEGDSGGGLVADGESSGDGREIIGIVSQGNKDCTKGKPAYYTRVNTYTNWIQEQVRESNRRSRSSRGIMEKLRESSFQ